MASNRKVLWICDKHEEPFTWAASVSHRTKQHSPTGCPKCSRASSTENWGRKPCLFLRLDGLSTCQSCLLSVALEVCSA